MALTLRPPRVIAITDPEPSRRRSSLFQSLSPTSQPFCLPKPRGSQTQSAPSPGIIATPTFATARVLISAPRAAAAGLTIGLADADPLIRLTSPPLRRPLIALGSAASD